MNPNGTSTISHTFDKAAFHVTTIDPVCGLLLAMMILMLLFSPRKFAVWPMVVIACFVTQLQRISLGSLDFTFIRIMACFGILRVFMRNEYAGLKWQKVDSWMLAFQGVRLLYAFAHITKSTNATPLTLCGETLDAWGYYFYFRCLVRDPEDLRNATYGFMWVVIINAPCFIYERLSLHNPFFFEGGVSDLTRSREGVMRCMGAYSHPILAGCFWAAILPYMGACLKWGGKIRFFPFFGIAGASVMIILCGSSTPIAGAGLAFFGGIAFLFRKHIKKIRWAFISMVVAAQCFATNNIWHLIARVHLVGGSTGYYRFKLIDQFIKHWKDWIIAGSAKGTSTWEMPMFDIVNYYVVLGLAGGIVFVILIIGLLYNACKSSGDATRSAGGNAEHALMGWATGVSIFTHLMTFLAITYFGQIMMVWYFSLAVTNIRSKNVGQRQQFSIRQGRMAQDALARLARPNVPYAQSIPMRNS